ncbi:hypothetical protein [Bacillus phage SPO1L4]|nr:hypothetical protein [Bacillus phage SPO1L4]
MANDPYTNPTGQYFDLNGGLCKAQFSSVHFSVYTSRKQINKEGDYILYDRINGNGYISFEDRRDITVCEAFGKSVYAKQGTGSVQFDLNLLSEETKQMMVDLWVRMEEEVKAKTKSSLKPL